MADDTASHPLQMLPPMPPAPPIFKDPMMICLFFFGTLWLVAVIAAAVSKVNLDAMVGSLATVHGVTAGGIAAAKTFANPYANAAKQPSAS